MTVEELKPTNFDEDEWETTEPANPSNDELLKHTETGTVVTPSRFERAWTEAEIIEKADVIPIERVEEQANYYSQRVRDNRRKGTATHETIAVGRKRSADDLQKLIDEFRTDD